MLLLASSSITVVSIVAYVDFWCVTKVLRATGGNDEQRRGMLSVLVAAKAVSPPARRWIRRRYLS